METALILSAAVFLFFLRMKNCLVAVLLLFGAGCVCAAPRSGGQKRGGRALQTEPARESGKEFNERFQRKLRKAGYTKTSPYSVRFRLSLVPARMEAVRLDEHYYIVHQTWLYWGLNNIPSSRMELNDNWDFKRQGDKYWYVSKPGKRMILWAQNENRTKSGYRRTDGYIYIHICSDGKNSQVQFSYERTNLLDTMILKRVVLDATKIRVQESCVVDKAHIDLSRKARRCIDMPGRQTQQ